MPSRWEIMVLRSFIPSMDLASFQRHMSLAVLRTEACIKLMKLGDL